MPHELPIAETLVAPTPLEAGLNQWQDRLDRLEAESDILAASNQFPEWYNAEDTTAIRELRPALIADEGNALGVSRYFVLHRREKALGSKITGQESYGRPLQQMILDLGEDIVGRGIAAEAFDGPMHIAILADLTNEGASENSFLTPELGALKSAYGTSTLTELLGVGGDEFSDKVRVALLQPSPLKWMRHNEQDGSKDMDFKWHQTQEAARKWMSQAVAVATGMPATEAIDYTFSASRNNDNENKFTIDIINKINSFGVDRIRQLSAFTGIHGLEAYTTEQLERMEAIAAKPAETSEALKQHDVTAVLINRFGDHNGVLRNVAAEFDDSSKRTVFFEITSMDDIYRRMVSLRKVGIQPSTLLLAAHSAPGQFMVTDVREKSKGEERRDIATVAGRKLVAMVNANGDLGPGNFGYSMNGMQGMARLVETYMKPSRGIDDDNSDEGRKKIIFSACHAGTEVKSGDIDDDGEKIQLGMESVISQLGKDLLASGVKTNVDIYGAPGGIQMHSTELGVHYSGQPDASSFDDTEFKRPHLAAHRVRIESGHLEKQEVHDIVLRKARLS